MFPLVKRKIGGFVFKQLYPKSFGTLYNHPHLGVDYSAKVGDKLYAPFDGKLTTLVGTEGGNTIWFCPDKQDVIIRFMHLSKFLVKSGSRVKEGDLIALTGNTGSSTTAPHVHCDISKHKVDIYNINNFVDPEKFKWESIQNIDNKIPSIQKIPSNIDTTNPSVKIELKPTETPNTTSYTVETPKPSPEQSQSVTGEIKTNIDPIKPDYLITKPEETTGIGEIINLFKDIFNYFKNLKK